MECLGDIVNPLTIFELDKTASRFLVDYLSRRGKRTKICHVYSEWIKILSGIPQDSVLGAISFNIFINDCFSWLLSQKYAIMLMTIRYILVVKFRKIYCVILSTIYIIF